MAEDSGTSEYVDANEGELHEEANEIVLVNVKNPDEASNESQEHSEEAEELAESAAEDGLGPVTISVDVCKRLTAQQVAGVFADAESYSVEEIPSEPQAGQIFCIDRKKHLDWHRDGYTWKSSSLKMETDDEAFKVKVYKQSSANKILEKYVYSLTDHADLLCIQYLVPDSVSVKAESRKRKGLTINEVLALLENCDDTVSGARALRPKGGELYLFNTDIIGEDWKCDDYIWRNCGTAFLPSKNPVIKKTFFNIRTPSTGDKGDTTFQKVAYVALNKQNIVLVQYIGDESVFVPMAHGNRKRGAVEHKRTCPSVLEKIKSSFQEDQDLEGFKKFSAVSSDAPRNMQQINNLKHRLKKRKAAVGGEDPNLLKSPKLSSEKELSEIIVFDDDGNPVLPPGYEIVQVSTIDENNEEREIPLDQVHKHGLLEQIEAHEAQVYEEADDSQDTNDSQGHMLHQITQMKQEPEPENAGGIEPEELLSQGAGKIEQHQILEQSQPEPEPEPELEIDVEQLQKELREKQKHIRKLQQKKLRLELEAMRNAQQPTATLQASAQPQYIQYEPHKAPVSIVKQHEQHQQQVQPGTVQIVQHVDGDAGTVVLADSSLDQSGAAGQQQQQTLYSMDGGVTYTVPGEYVQHSAAQNVVYVQDVDGTEQVVVIQEPPGQ